MAIRSAILRKMTLKIAIFGRLIVVDLEELPFLYLGYQLQLGRYSQSILKVNSDDILPYFIFPIPISCNDYM